MTRFQAIGLMSGTSLDGIDAAVIETDGETRITRLGFLTVPYEDGLRDRIRAALNITPAELPGAGEVEREITRAQAAVVMQLLTQCNLKPSDINLIGFHGQTVAHDPKNKWTCQLGDGALLAQLTGIPVVNDFRSADVQAGGQGAPLVPVYHQALAASRAKPVAFLNIGGVANLTYIGDEVIAFDTGPGNALIDDWMLRKTGAARDDYGATAARGMVNLPILTDLLNDKFFSEKPPKSLDRNAFVSAAWENLSVEDGAATLAAFTAHSVANALFFLPEKPREWIVAGGGRLNNTIMAMLREKLAAPVLSIDDIGLNGDAIEAEAFAFMAVRSYRGLPISFPKTTGVPHPMVGGKLNHVADAA
ncbi:MAG TPA: anhydro-N-acetylmuramic acid kinase [Patescibacteria group bacterium]|nr:anhydro-N-acetylmuramic acid kinase [Patescibacteria group bacterium]